jgi:hypothetical protein
MTRSPFSRAICGVALTLSTHAALAQERACVPIDGQIKLQTYDKKGDSAAFLVDRFGNVLSRPSQPIDENDRVTVHVITTEAASKFLRVQRTSAIRNVSVVNVLGGGEISVRSLTEIRTMISASGQCRIPFTLADFAPGRGDVQISMLYAQDDNTIKSVAMGNLDFTVQPLYIGAFSLGPIRSQMKRPQFGTVVVGPDTLATQVETDNPRLAYAMFFTPFILGGKRDLEKAPKNIFHRLSVSLGIPLKDIGQEALVGATIALPFGFYLHGGKHFGVVTEIDPTSGIAIGQPVNGGVVATRKATSSANYFGVTLDLKVMLKLIQTASGTSIP